MRIYRPDKRALWQSAPSPAAQVAPSLNLFYKSSVARSIARKYFILSHENTALDVRYSGQGFSHYKANGRRHAVKVRTQPKDYLFYPALLGLVSSLETDSRCIVLNTERGIL